MSLLNTSDRISPVVDRRSAMTRLTPLLYAATLFVSALLLFSVQPMFAKMVLPKLGGAPAVWSVAMVFFQTTLLAGYAYARVLSRTLRSRRVAMLHLLLVGITAMTLPIAVAPGWLAPPPDGTALWLFGLFAVSIGLPFFTLSASAPLLQSWFASSGHERAGNPYVLYAASNLGSFAALFAYPVVVEPFLTLKTQTAAWSIGFALLAGDHRTQSRRVRAADADVPWRTLCAASQPAAADGVLPLHVVWRGDRWRLRRAAGAADIQRQLRISDPGRARAAVHARPLHRR